MTIQQMAMILSALAPRPERPEAVFLKSRGWLPLGKNSSNGIEGWGKVINREAITIDEPDALKREGWSQ